MAGELRTVHFSGNRRFVEAKETRSPRDAEAPIPMVEYATVRLDFMSRPSLCPFVLSTQSKVAVCPAADVA
jgi:hypothetical protein